MAVFVFSPRLSLRARRMSHLPFMRVPWILIGPAVDESVTLKKTVFAIGLLLNPVPLNCKIEPPPQLTYKSSK